MGDSSTCVYTEGDAGDGETHTLYLAPNGESTWAWTGADVGCLAPNRDDCIDEGIPHDTDTTYDAHTCPAICTAVKALPTLTDCPAACAVAGTTFANVVGWAYARFVAGVGVDPTFVVVVESAGGAACANSVATVLTTSYVNYTTGAFDVGCPWTDSNIDGYNLALQITAAAASDPTRATVAGLTVDLRHPNWRDTVTYDWVSIKKARGVLDFRAAASAGETYSFDVYDWDAAAYNTRDTVSGASLTDYTYILVTTSEISSDGSVRIRWVDQNQVADEVQGTLTLDYAAISQTTEDGGGTGGDLPLRVDCIQRSLTAAQCTASFPGLAEGIRLERTMWYADGRFLAVCDAGSAHSSSTCVFARSAHQLVLDIGFRVQAAINVTVSATFDNGQTLLGWGRASMDNLPLVATLAFAVGAAVLLLLLHRYAKRARRGDARRAKAERRKAALAPDWRTRLWQGGGRG